MPSQTICARIWLRNRLIRWTAYEVLLEIARFSDGERDEAFVGYLRALFATHPPDLIITMVSPAARFIQRHQTRSLSFHARYFCRP